MLFKSSRRFLAWRTETLSSDRGRDDYVAIAVFCLDSDRILGCFRRRSRVDRQVVRESANGEFIADHYPPGAYKRGEQGKVAFRLTIEPDGSLGTCDVTESSGFAALDKETCEVLLRYARLKTVRSSDGRAIRATQTGFIVWRLPAGVKVAVASAKTMPKPDKIICRRSPSTGSLIQRTKQCMTASQWAETNRINRDQIDRLQGRGHFEDENPQ